MFGWLAAAFLLFPLALPGAAAAQTPTPGQAPDSATAPSGPANPNTAAEKKVWTNENLAEAKGSVSVVGNKHNLKNNTTPAQTADAAAVSRIRTNLQKLQAKLDDVNKQLETFKEFQDGEAVSTNKKQLNKGYTLVPVDQQMAALQEKKKKLEMQIGELTDEARKKGIEPGQLR